MKINTAMAQMPAGYLFAEIAKRVKAYSADHPQASILRLHPNATILVDKAAASLL